MSKKMDRVQFYLEPEANKSLDQLSNKLNRSKADLIREGVQKIIKEKMPLEQDPAYQLIGFINDEDHENDVAKKHDYYLYRKEQENTDEK